MESTMRFRVNQPKVIHENYDEEVVIVNLDNGSYYSTDKAGADIWSYIQIGETVHGITEGITRKYEGSPDDIARAVIRFIEELRSEALIVEHTAKLVEKRNGIALPAEDGREKPGFEVPALRKYEDMQDLLLLDPIHDVDETGWPHTPGPLDRGN